MLYQILNLQDPWIDLVKDDPVRPEIPTSARIHDFAGIFLWIEDDRPQAITCVKYTKEVPCSVQELDLNNCPEVAVFYTIWSYRKGSGQKLIRAAQQWIHDNRPYIKRYVTLSPKTEMAKLFHHRNGAVTLRENPETVNYEYQY